MLFFVLFLLSIVASTAGYVVDLDETVETRIGEFVRGLREERLNNNEVDSEDLKFHDGDDDDNENSIYMNSNEKKKYLELRELLKDILSSDDRAESILASIDIEEESGGGKVKENTSTISDDSSSQNVEVSVDGQSQGLRPPSCDSFLSCDSCVSNSCAWCILSRSCRPDRAWECQGEVDHVGLGGIGSHTQCPNLDEIDRKRAEKKKRKEEAEQERRDEADKLKKLREGDTLPDLSDNKDDSNSNTNPGYDKIERWNELKRRSELSKSTDGYGTKFPYEVLGLDMTCSTTDIKKQYRRLSVQFHPDKNTDSDVKELAEMVFKDLADAYGLLSDPAKRAMYDDIGAGEEHESFDSQEAYERYGKENVSNFYANDKNISPLTDNLWDRRVGSNDQVWLVEFYAPWCSACQNFINMYKEIAEELSEDTHVEVGAVNCETQKDICAEYGISSYPTIMVLNDKWKTTHEWINSNTKTTPSVTNWVRTVSREWKYLFQTSNVEPITNLEGFQNTIVNSTEFWVVAFMDGLDCGACKTAKTNCMRLSASLRGYPDVRVGIVDCEEPDARELCYEHQKLPPRPHAPVVKGYASGIKAENGGELLYNANEVEPHIALRMLDSAIRLSMASTVKAGTLGVADGIDGFKAEEKEEDEEPEPPQPPPEPLWDGPVRRQPLPWNQGANGPPRNRQRIGA
jgi:thiol-disulfide isomerase/thioredoxin